MTLAGTHHQTAAQRGGEAKDKDKPLSDTQRDRSQLMHVLELALTVQLPNNLLALFFMSVYHGKHIRDCACHDSRTVCSCLALLQDTPCA